MKKIFASICFASFLFTSSLLMARGGGGFAHSGSPVKKYIKKNVIPVLVQKRQILEDELTPAEKASIADYRIALKKLHGAHKHSEYATPAQQDINNLQPGSTASYSRKDIMLKLEVIASNHNNTLNIIKTDLAPLRKQWNDDIQHLETQSGSTTKNPRKYTKFIIYLAGKGHHSNARFLLLDADSTSASR
jgi:hypothetical protein